MGYNYGSTVGAWDFGANRLMLETDCLEAVESLEDLQQHNMET